VLFEDRAIGRYPEPEETSWRRSWRTPAGEQAADSLDLPIKFITDVALENERYVFVGIGVLRSKSRAANGYSRQSDGKAQVDIRQNGAGPGRLRDQDQPCRDCEPPACVGTQEKVCCFARSRRE